MIAAVEFPIPLKQQLRAEAFRAYPRECCGLIEGRAAGALLRVIALHPTSNVSEQADSFEIDPAAHIALLRSLRGTGRDIIGCYHSHPNGRAEPSVYDRESATEQGFLWLIAAINDEARTANTAAFVFAAQDFSPVPIVHGAPGAGLSPPCAARITAAPASCSHRLAVRTRPSQG